MSLSKGDKATLHNAAKLLSRLAIDFFESNQVDGNLRDASDIREHADIAGTAARLKEIARHGE